MRAVQTVKQAMKNFNIRHRSSKKLVEVDFVEFVPRVFVPIQCRIGGTVEGAEDGGVDLGVVLLQLPH